MWDGLAESITPGIGDLNCLGVVCNCPLCPTLSCGSEAQSQLCPLCSRARKSDTTIHAWLPSGSLTAIVSLGKEVQNVIVPGLDSSEYIDYMASTRVEPKYVLGLPSPVTKLL